MDTMWIPTLSDQSLPRYRAIADAIADAVNSGDLSPGHRLPPQRQLAWKLGVTVGTIGRAYDLARQRGFVAGEVGRGTYVQIAPAERQPILSRDHIGNLIDLSLNQPASGRQAEQFRKTLTEVGATSELRDLMNYPPRRCPRRLVSDGQ